MEICLLACHLDHWLKRNQLIFQNKGTHSTAIVEIRKRAMEYFLCGLGPSPTSRSANMLVRWERPGQGKLKLNTDGSAQGNAGLAGGGGVLHDDQGNWVLGYSRKIERTTSFSAELWALRDGLHLCLSKNHLDMEVELDANIIVDALTTTQQDKDMCPVRGCKKIMETSWRLGHILLQ
ncbi:hypothetical protein SO802_010858 [Lithocarpus litseifolius]|uniref:RNase H type-1 domain-containing protein n=1 Tax=Lithocarpus litseifolius TaxID=425828 RepID=A0AAW2DFY8_9ROSI